METVAYQVEFSEDGGGINFGSAKESSRDRDVTPSISDTNFGLRMEVQVKRPKVEWRTTMDKIKNARK